MATIGPPEANMHQIDLTKLSIPQLTQLKEQLDQELVVFQNSLQSLKVALKKFQNSADCLGNFGPESEDKPLLVPLTGSMYVPGRLKDTNRVIIDIGTGYYAEMDNDASKDYFKRKVAFVTEQMEKIQIIGLEKSKIRDAVASVLGMRMKQQINTAQ
ncbi:probable prefoldin subunit 5 [Agrilus planipennis]|uniref:Probable prefoldin subunit 5 n=1 Tax=Agrilus planipennis TaxID=224129 RepID=A0A1W4XHG1_AGRPL|nr:probable prefoldin subunit 5 [Agrilus planipennis]